MGAQAQYNIRRHRAASLWQTRPPRGYETVFRYLRKASPDAFEGLSPFEVAIYCDEDAFKIADVCLDAGQRVLHLDAPAEFRREGVYSFLAFPEAMVRKHFQQQAEASNAD